MKKYRYKNGIHEGDHRVLLLTLGIALFGIIMEFSAGYYISMGKAKGDPYAFLKTAILWFAISWVAFILASLVNYKYYRFLAIPALIIGFALLVLVFTKFGVTINNATRWIGIKDKFTLMPGEIIKTCAILFFGWFLAVKKEHYTKFAWVAFSFAIAFAAFYLIYKQPNLSTAIIVVALIIGMMFLAGLPWYYIIAILVLFAGLVAFLLLYKGGYMWVRVTSFAHPFDDALGTGYQVVQGLLALGSGGVFGVGLGNSIQKAFYLPEAQSDFILAIIGEELGFAGILVLLIAYFALLYAVFSVAVRAKDKFGMLLAAGVGLHLGLQVVLNVAVVTASAPATGVVLPLVSAGGNALVLYMAELGMVYNISKQARFTDSGEEPENGSETKE